MFTNDFQGLGIDTFRLTRVSLGFLLTSDTVCAVLESLACFYCMLWSKMYIAMQCQMKIFSNAVVWSWYSNSEYSLCCWLLVCLVCFKTPFLLIKIKIREYSLSHIFSNCGCYVLITCKVTDFIAPQLLLLLWLYCVFQPNFYYKILPCCWQVGRGRLRQDICNAL